MKILIIGGGWAGISAAVEASERGHQVFLVEERPYLGGRARSFIDRESGHHIDNGQHVMMGCYSSFLRVLQALGTEHLLERQRALQVAFVDKSATKSVLDASILPGKLGVVAGLLRLSGVQFTSRIACVRLAIAIALGTVHTTDCTCSEFLRRAKQPEDIVKRFWEPLVLATLNAPLDKASAELLVAVMRLAFLGSREDSSLLIPTCGLSDLIEPLPSWVASRGGSVKLSTSVDRLIIADHRCRQVVLSDGTIHHVDAVISAIPQRALERLCASSGTPVTFPAAPESSPIVSLYLWYTEQWMTHELLAALGTTVQWVFNKRRIARGLVALTVSAGHSIVGVSQDEIIRHCDAELRELLPEARHATLIRGLVIKEKMATPLFTPTTQRIRADHFMDQLENLLLAGDWTATGLPATIEGAARSGIWAIDCLSRVP
ncbi:MAG: FAD-dependent oxidoreductase [Ignavibacteria bacterium]|nr:FAD-dependent oxidoreductase [Ignavibacteria bacterium]